MDSREELIEQLSAEIHKCYCRYYRNRYGHDYHTIGDYNKLDEATKDADREMAKWVIKDRERICGPLVKFKNDNYQFDSNELLRRYGQAVNETLKLAGVQP